MEGWIFLVLAYGKEGWEFVLILKEGVGVLL